MATEQQRKQVADYIIDIVTAEGSSDKRIEMALQGFPKSEREQITEEVEELLAGSGNSEALQRFKDNI